VTKPHTLRNLAILYTLTVAIGAAVKVWLDISWTAAGLIVGAPFLIAALNPRQRR